MLNKGVLFVFSLLGYMEHKHNITKRGTVQVALVEDIRY